MSAHAMNREEIEARMREIERRFDTPPFTPAEGRAMVLEYMALEAMLAAMGGGGPD